MTGMTLIEFLTARLDEDAEHAYSGWSRDPGERWENTDEGQSVMTPRAVLAEVEAKRRIVDQHAHFERTFTGDEYQDGMAAGYGDVVKLLALPYADHPDFDEAWRP